LRSVADWRYGNPVRILSGHRVIDAVRMSNVRDRQYLARGCLTLAQFAERLRHLKSGYRLTPLGDYIAALRAGTGMPPGSVVLTFDDGFRDLYVNALQVFLAECVPVSIFLTTGMLGSGDPMLEASDVREMAKRARGLITWGAHGVTHRALTEMSLTDAEEEIVRSRAAVEALTGERVSLFCYPDGKYNVAIQDLLRKHDFVGACATGRALSAGVVDPLALKRIPFESEPLHRFAFRVAGRL
jgi:peptidoglycan/xylan/chitin deacetylase (PgdA/CDA1 family)